MKSKDEHKMDTDMKHGSDEHKMIGQMNHQMTGHGMHVEMFRTRFFVCLVLTIPVLVKLPIFYSFSALCVTLFCGLDLLLRRLALP